MKVIKHGAYYFEEKKINCDCGCEFEYNKDDIGIDYSLAYNTYPSQRKQFVACPECGHKTYLGTVYITGTQYTSKDIQKLTFEANKNHIPDIEYYTEEEI